MLLLSHNNKVALCYTGITILVKIANVPGDSMSNKKFVSMVMVSHNSGGKISLSIFWNTQDRTSVSLINHHSYNMWVLQFFASVADQQ